MKQEKIKAEISEYLAVIEENAKGRHSHAQVHELRTNFKKLRAFIRLIHSHRPQKEILEQLKPVYAAAGQLRDLELHSRFIIAYAKKNETSLDVYRELLSGKIKAAKKELAGKVDNFQFSSLGEELCKKLPESLKTEKIEAFVGEHIKQARHILHKKHNDEHIHSMRKYLKDAMYAIKYLPEKQYEAQDKLLKEITDALGNYIDAHMAQSHLAKALKMKLPAAEVKTLAQLKKLHAADKRNLKKQVLQEMEKL